VPEPADGSQPEATAGPGAPRCLGLGLDGAPHRQLARLARRVRINDAPCPPFTSHGASIYVVSSQLRPQTSRRVGESQARPGGTHGTTARAQLGCSRAAAAAATARRRAALADARASSPATRRRRSSCGTHHTTHRDKNRARTGCKRKVMSATATVPQPAILGNRS
jgi:hypothetical protein